MRKLSLSDYLVMPWKNGGGMTTQLAIHPAGAHFANFDWRISMARVSASGPFSRLPGVDRSLAIVEGAGLRLATTGRAPLRMDDVSPAHVFPGEWSIDSELVDGAVTDFNVMTRREGWTHKLERLRLHGNVALEGADEAFVYCAQGETHVGDLPVSAGEAAQTGPCATLDLRANAPALLYLVRLHRKNQKGTIHA